MSLSRRHALAGLAGLALSGCQVAPGTGQSSFNLLSADDEQQIGRETHPQILKEFGGGYDDPTVSAYIAGIGQRLVRVTETPAADFRFTVLNSQIVNAMALPGGYIYVTRGLLALCGNEAEIAGVVGHEIGHVLARHTAERVSRAQASSVLTGVLGAVLNVPGVADVAQMGAAAYLQSFSRDQESQADQLGLRYMARAGWHPHAMVTMLEKLRDQARLEALMAGRSADSVDQLDFMASHPRTIDRVQAAMAAEGTASQGELGVDAYLDRMDGLVYGDDVAEGVVRDRAFIHPALGLRFEVPAGFRLANGAAAVTASHPSGAAIVFDGAKVQGIGSMADYLRGIWLKGATLSGLEEIEINGMPAATAAARGRNKTGTVDIRAVAIRFDAGQAYRFLFATPPAQTASLGVELRRTTYSFRKLSAEEKAAVRPWRLKVVRAGSGDSAETLAARMAPDQWKPELFRVLNGLPAGGQPQAGQRVKLVVSS